MIKINAGLHSSQKDHTVMTGGTLTADKHIDSETPLQIHTYALPLFTAPSEAEYDDFHAGMHTNEHLLAYTPDTGSLRASLAELIPGLDTKMILDVSPFEFENGSYGFRITSLVELDADTLRRATRASVEKAIAYIDKIKAGGGDKDGFAGVPFATAGQCGQFTFHHPKKAQESLQDIESENLVIHSHSQKTDHQKAVVCDLRLLKPKTDENDDRITLDPKLSYYLSQYIERELPKKMPGTAVVVGTFGCMTGTYLCVSCENPETDLRIIHHHIMDILETMPMDSFTDAHRAQLTQILTNYTEYGEK
jgi:S-ribosylhomocysteine lyase LuxS involved in autoinducer biosynthesis